MTDVADNKADSGITAVEAIAWELSRAHDAAACEGVIEGWRAAARVAIELGARLPGDPAVEAWCAADRENRRDRFRELLGSDSTNFLGTGLSLREFMELYTAEQIARSWSLQSPEEKKRRLGAVVRLSAELERIREKENFATRLAEMAIEAVIEGDWEMVEEWAEHFSFEGDRDEIRIHGSAIYATFRELLLQALRAGKEGPA